jgi:hypothetical protein
VSRAWLEADPLSLERLERTLRARYPPLHAFVEDGVCIVRGTYPVADGGKVTTDTG